MPISPTKDAEGDLCVRVWSAGRLLPDTAVVLSLTIRRALGAIPGATLVLADDGLLASCQSLVDGDEFAPGTEIRIAAGYGDGEAELFAGTVVKLGLRLGGSNAIRLVVECRDRAVALQGAQALEPELSATLGQDLIACEADLEAPGAQGAASAREPSGRVQFQGSALARVGERLRLQGLGVRLGGDVLLTAVEHRIQDGNWLTAASFGPAPEAAKPLPTPAAEAVADPAYGLADLLPGAVVEREGDSLAFVTRGGHRLEFDDVRGKVRVATAAGNALVLSDEDGSLALQDANGNRVVLGPEGIVLDSASDLRLAARGGIVLAGVGPVGVQSQADVSCKGLNVACEAQVGFSGKGAATAELSAAGQTTVRGALVMIN